MDFKTDGKKLLIVTIGCLVALSVHQMVIAPKIAAKQKKA
jgi:hypothetical protein